MKGKQQSSRPPDCHCDYSPNSTGPEEDCPHHGRPYAYWVARSDALAARLASVEALADEWEAAELEADDWGPRCAYTGNDCAAALRAVLGSDAHTEQKGTGRMSAPDWSELPHEFVEDVDDGSMCLCGIPVLTHDDVMAARPPVTASDARPPSDTGTRVEVCRTCARPITHEKRTEPGYLPREGWYDDCRVDALVCFKAIDYRHIPLEGRERAIYDAGYKAGLAALAGQGQP